MLRLCSKVCCVVFCLVLAACGSQTASPTPAPSPTVELTPTASQPTPTSGSVDTPVERGRALFLTSLPQVDFACATCHYLMSERRLIGPGLQNLAARAAEYNPEDDLETYIRNSIIEPDAFITPGVPPYPAGLMPSQYKDFLSDDDIDDLIAFILSL